MNFGDTVMESTVLTQYSMANGLKEFGEKGVEAVMTEIKQLHDREVIIPVEASKLSREEKKAALEYLMFLSKNRCGRYKDEDVLMEESREKRLKKKMLALQQ
jgi:hypothetical protein